MNVLTARQIERVYELTDSLRLNRDWVVIPLTASGKGLEMLMPDGKILIRPPAGGAFEEWFSGLRGRLERLELDRALRASQPERHTVRTPADAPPGSGPRRYLGGG